MENDLASDLLLGCGPIAEEVLGSRSRKAKRKIYHMHQRRLLPTFKMGGEIAARRSALRQRISEQEAAAAIITDTERTTA